MENEVLAPVEETKVPVTESVTVVDDDDCSTGSKVAFYVILGLIGVTIVGIPIVVYLWKKERKKRIDAEDKLKQLQAAAEAPAAEEVKAEEKAEEK